MGGLVRLARPLNCVMSAVGVGIGGIVAVGTQAWGEFAIPLALAGLAAASFTAGGNALNDIYDRTTDAINHPDRPLPAGQITLAGAKAFAGSAFALAALLAFFVNLWVVAIVAFNAALMFAYESTLKARGGPGNVAIAFLVASLFVFGGVATYRASPDPIIRTAFLGSLAFCATLGREITKDIEDMGGDVDRRTLPQRIGATRAGQVAAEGEHHGLQQRGRGAQEAGGFGLEGLDGDGLHVGGDAAQRVVEGGHILPQGLDGGLPPSFVCQAVGHVRPLPTRDASTVRCRRQ